VAKIFFVKISLSISLISSLETFVCTVKTYSSSSLPDVSSIWCTFLLFKKISNEDVQYVRKKTQKPTKQHSKFNTNYSNEWKFCGKKHKPNKELCLAYDKTCSNGGIKNHFAFKCRKIKR
jgi:hypothetical protein